MDSSYSTDLTRVGPGTAIGELMRQYWLPAAMSAELEPDGPPMRLPLLGEKLIAFRDTSGRVGVMDQRCPHRCASLFLGRNEHDGIRCIYHGWKYEVDGTCVDMPNVPNQAEFRPKVRANAYPATERAGLVWVYMGARAVPPPLPHLEATLLPSEELDIQFVHRDCNWLQALEGDIDTSHFGFLHAGHLDADDLDEDNPLYFTVTNRSPAYNVTSTPWGTSYGAHRSASEAETYWRFANFLFPFYTQQPQGMFARHVHFRAWVPLDDTHTMFMNVMWRGMSRAVTPRTKDDRAIAGLRLANDYQPRSTDWFGRFRLTRNESNDWGIDREAQSTGAIYSGIDEIHLQDQAITESMGPVTNFELEHLTVSDQMITRTRRRMLTAARALRDEGTVPPGVDEPGVYRRARSGFFLADSTIDWQVAYAAQAASMEIPGDLAVAAP